MTAKLIILAIIMVLVMAFRYPAVSTALVLTVIALLGEF